MLLVDQRVLRPREEEEWPVRKGFGFDITFSCGPEIGNTDLAFAAYNVVGDAVETGDPHPAVNLGVGGEQSCDCLLSGKRRGVRCQAHLQRPRAESLEELDLVLQLGDVVEDVPGTVDNHASEGGGFNTAMTAVEEPNVERRLEGLDAAAQCWLGQMERTSGLAEVVVFGQSHHVRQFMCLNHEKNLSKSQQICI